MKFINDRRRMQGQSGFTLIELLVVIAILGVLAGVVVFAVGGIDGQRRGVGVQDRQAHDPDRRRGVPGAEPPRIRLRPTAPSTGRRRRTADLATSKFLDRERPSKYWVYSPRCTAPVTRLRPTGSDVTLGTPGAGALYRIDAPNAHMTDTSALDAWLKDMLSSRATDLHFSAGSVPRARIDGRLSAAAGSQPVDEVALTAMIEGLIGPDRREEFRVEPSDRLRLQLDVARRHPRALPGQRLLPVGQARAGASPHPGRAFRHPRSIGLPASTAALAQRPHGLVLFTGPTGSGKSTTQAAMLGWINRNRPLHILTIEDPIEYVHDSNASLVNQREVGTDVPTFEAGLEAALREDPDVVLVGEMRTLETIALTLTLAETGHLVLATLHTNDASQAVDRIIDSFPATQQDQVRTQLSMMLAAVISQRLVPRIGGGRVAAYEVLMGTTRRDEPDPRGQGPPAPQRDGDRPARRHVRARALADRPRRERPDLDRGSPRRQPVPRRDPRRVGRNRTHRHDGVTR